MDAVDSEKRSPLLLAASRGGSRSLRILLDAGASVGARDSQKRNALHFLVSNISNGALAEEFNLICQVFHFRKFLKFFQNFFQFHSDF